MLRRLPRALGTRLALARGMFERFAGRLRTGLLEARTRDAAVRLSGLARLLDQLHPDKPLARGYARVAARGGATVTSKAGAAAARALTLHFADGAIDARVEGAAKPSYSPPRGPQPSLFD